MTTPSSDAFGLAGKVCVVTGAASGIGRSIALALGQQGATVAVLDRNPEGCRQTVALLDAAGGKGLAVDCDISDEVSVDAARAAVVAAFGEADILVNNAAIVRRGALDTLPLDDWNTLLAVNLTGYFICSRVFARGMRAKGAGVIVHVSSVMADFPSPLGGAYSVAKAGVNMLSRLQATEWGPSGIRSNCVQPCLVITPLSQPIYDQPEILRGRSNAVPLRRIGMPDDIANAVLFLASPLSSYMNGAEVVVDGGISSNLMNLVPRTVAMGGAPQTPSSDSSTR